MATEWSKTPPSEAGWYWAQRYEIGREPQLVALYKKLERLVTTAAISHEWGPRIPSPDAIEAAKEALRGATFGLDGCNTFDAAPCGECVPCRARAALDKLEGRS